ncbi:MAG: ring-cleaving dioxygenase [Anaerolineales bacterium]|nr:ring-cleaving dioxygenase [Anaerolineales bacterium]
MQLTGIHHVTAVSARIANNLDFYTNLLGLRLVKKSVNQDDVSAYHLFYADELGSPGTDMTFFDWPEIRPNQRGSDSIAGTAFRVASQAALEFWAQRFEQLGVQQEPITAFAGRQLLPFEDPEGQQLYLVNDQGAPFEGKIWSQPDIPDAFALRGFYSVILSVPALGQLDRILRHVLNYQERQRATWLDGQSQAVIYATLDNGGPGSEVWLLEQPHLERARLGAGGTHHVAFRVPDFETEKQWHDHLNQAGLRVSGLIDRFWFRSIYFRVSPGILFEIATDGPGFAVDEDADKLGEKLVLPPFLEPRRAEIEANLKPIGVPAEA